MPTPLPLIFPVFLSSLMTPRAPTLLSEPYRHSNLNTKISILEARLHTREHMAFISLGLHYISMFSNSVHIPENLFFMSEEDSIVHVHWIFTIPSSVGGCLG